MVVHSDGFKFWHSYFEALKCMSDDAARGRFVMAICAYVFDGVEPEFSNEMERFGFTLVADQAAESKRLYDVAKTKGSKGGRPRKSEFSTKKKTTGLSTAKTTGLSTAKTTGSTTGLTVSRYVSSSFQEEEGGAADAGPKGPPPPLPRFGGGER